MSEIYLDNAASTPIDPLVLQAYIKASNEYWANPSSVKHEHGRYAKKGLEQARSKIGQLLGLNPKGLIFTSGATEANNLALRGTTCLFENNCAAIVSSIEHACVDESAKRLIQRGVTLKVAPVTVNGAIDLKQLEDLCRNTKNLKLISVIAVNNETGVIQPLGEISKIAKTYGALLHTDAVQAIGKVPLSLLQVADLISISAHKLNGPKGIGCLWISEKVRLDPLIVGGGQEAGIRSGTCPVPLIVAFAETIRLCLTENAWQTPINIALRRLETEILQQIPGAKVNGLYASRVSTISNISFPSQQLVVDVIKGLAISSGAACGCTKTKPSKVLLAMGLSEHLAKNCIRISAGKYTTLQDIETAKNILLSTLKMIK